MSMVSFFRLIIRFRFWMVGAILLVTAGSLLIISQGVMSSSIGRMFLGEYPAYQRYLERIKDFGNNDVLIVAFEEPRLLDVDRQKAIRSVVDVVEGFQYVKSVTSLLDLQQIKVDDDTLTITPYADQAEKSPENKNAILAALCKDPFAKGLLISKDCRSGAVIIEIDGEADVPAEQAPILYEKILKTFGANGFSKEQLHLVGIPASIAAVVEQTGFNIKRLFPLVCVLLLLTVWLMFRRLWPVALTMTVALIAVIWTMAFSIILDRNVSILASMVPPVILIISFSDVVHLCSAYLLELGKGAGKDEAIYKSGADVGQACLLTSLTTFVGFLSMSLIPTPIFRQMGLVLGFGVAIALLLAITVVPIFFSFMNKPKAWRVGTTGRVQDFLDTVLKKSAWLAAHKPWTVVIGFTVVAALSIVGIFKVHVETDFTQRLSKDHPLQLDGKYFKTNFSGSNFLDVFIRAPQKDGLMDPKLFEKIAQFQRQSVALVEVDRAQSLVDLMAAIHEAFNQDVKGSGALPMSRQALAQYLLLFESSGGEDLDRLVDFNRQTMRVTFSLKDEGVVETWRIGQKVEAIAARTIGSGAQVEVSGMMVLMGQWLEQIVAGQRRGLGAALGAIALLMIIGLRSIRAGAWSMIPNVLPLLVLGGYLGFFWHNVDSDVMALAMVAIGIGVDDTIHFLMRLRIELEKTDDIDEAIERTYYFSGRGIIITTVILVVGFAPFALSDYLSVNMMGTLLPMTLIVALLADLLFVPAMVKLGAIRFNLHNEKSKVTNEMSK